MKPSQVCSKASELAKAVISLARTQIIHKYAKDGFSSVGSLFTFATVFYVFVLSENRFFSEYTDKHYKMTKLFICVSEKFYSSHK
jgi:hypothetical protein